MTAKDAVEAVLRRVGSRTNGRGMWTCPGHDDRRPSLSVSAGDGRVLLHCHAGCQTDAVLRTLDLAAADLFDSPRRRKIGSRRSAAESRKRIAEYLYCDRMGELLARKVRYAPKGFGWEVPDGHGGWRMAGAGEGNPGVLYRLPEILEADGPIHLGEGEKAADALSAAGHAATCAPTTKLTSNLLSPLAGRDVVVWCDRDVPGRMRAMAAVQALRGVAKNVRAVQSATGGAHDDAYDHLAAGFTVEQTVEMPDLSPEEAPDLARLLDNVCIWLESYVVFPMPEQRDAVTLWALATHVMAQAETFPILAVTSAEMRSGKTRCLDCLELLVARPWRAILPSDAVVFRKIEAEMPTLLLDEVDAIFGPRAPEHEGLRAILNAGHRRGAKVSRCAPPRFELVEFEVFCAKVLAGIGNVPDTVADRSIPVRMKRRAPGEKVRRFRHRIAEAEAEPLRAAIIAWAQIASLEGAEPDSPEALDDRAADGWEILLALADLAGGSWPSRSRAAAVALHVGEEEPEETLGVRLLRDIETVFSSVILSDVITTASLLEHLRNLEEAPWGSIRKGAPIDANWLARRLKGYGIKSTKIDGGQRRGFRREQFHDAWSRYLAASAERPSDLSDPSRSCSQASASPSVTDAWAGGSGQAEEGTQPSRTPENAGLGLHTDGTDAPDADFREGDGGAPW